MTPTRPSPVNEPTRQGSTGFTAIELVLALVATFIVAALIVSALRTHAVRTQVVSGLRLASPWRMLVEMRFRQSGQVPKNWEDLGAGSATISSIYVQTVRLEKGRIDIVYGNDASAPIAGRHLSLVPYETADQTIVWICGADDPGPGLQPLGFAGGGTQPDALDVTIAVRYLPPECR